MPIVVAVLAAWSCSSRDELQSEQERVPIRLATSLDGTGARTTRAGTTNNVTQSTEFLAGQYVDAYIKVKGGDWLTGLSATTPRHFQVNTTDTNSDGIVDGDLDRKSGEAMDYYPMDATPVTIYAVHPSVASDAAFTVSNNQMDADNYAASDLCYSKTKDYNRTESKQTLRFKHVLSKIVVNVDVSELGTPAVSNLRLKAKTQTSITYPYPSDATNDYQIGSASEVDYIKMNVGGAAIIPPQKTSAVGDVLITFDVAGVGPVAYKFPANTTFASNTQYIYTVKVGGTISVTSTITDWDAGTYSPGDEFVSLPKNMKNPLWYVSDYYLASDGVNFDKRESTSQGYLFQWNGAMGLGYTYNTTGYNGYLLPSSRKTVNNGESGVTWHIPTFLELRSILPAEGEAYTTYNFFTSSYPTANTTITEYACTFGYNNDTKYGVGNTSNPANPTGTQFKSYWSSYSNNLIRYAIRFLGTKYCSVWKYEIVDLNTTNGRLVISSKLIDPIGENDNTALSNKMSEIMNANYNWDADEADGCVVRTFYLTGFGSSTPQASPGDGCPHIQGDFWSSTKNTTYGTSYFMRYAKVDGVDYLYLHRDAITRGFSVRLFRDN